MDLASANCVLQGTAKARASQASIQAPSDQRAHSLQLYLDNQIALIELSRTEIISIIPQTGATQSI